VRRSHGGPFAFSQLKGFFPRLIKAQFWERGEFIRSEMPLPGVNRAILLRYANLNRAMSTSCMMIFWASQSPAAPRAHKVGAIGPPVRSLIKCWS